MRKFFILLLAITVGYSCSQPVAQNNAPEKPAANGTTLQTFPVKGGWGYSIDVNGKKFIRQETIPVLQGQRPFKTKEHAEKVGAWVETHIRHNEGFSLTLPVLQHLIGAENIKN